MIAYKFLSSDRVGLFSGVRWPEPGTWLEADAEVERCASGIHAVHAEGLLGWIDDELWTCELDGIVEDDGRELVAERGRLLEQVAAWNETAARDFARACAARGRDHVVEALRAEGHDDAAKELAGLDAEDYVTTAPDLAARLPAEIGVSCSWPQTRRRSPRVVTSRHASRSCARTSKRSPMAALRMAQTRQT